MPLITNESLGKEGGKLILAEISNKTTLWYHTIWRKTCCQKIKCTIKILHHIKWSLGAQGLRSGAYICRQIVGRAWSTGFVCCLGMIYQRPWCRQINIEASWHLTEPFCSAALGHAESPWAQHVQRQGERKRGHGFWFNTHLADQNASE